MPWVPSHPTYNPSPTASPGTLTDPRPPKTCDPHREVQLVPASDSSVLAVFGHQISPSLHDQVIALYRAIQNAPPPWLENLHPAYASLLIDFNPALANHRSVAEFIRAIPAITEQHQPGKLVQVEVEYNGEDIEEIAYNHGITVENLKRLHSTPIYRVAFLGFAPGFAYLLGLPPALATPRLATPRLRVPAGSVAIGGAQTGIYPADSPGGWRIIGHVAGPQKTLPPDWVSPGDRVQFLPV